MATTVLEGRRIQVQGTVQGVGFRPWVYRLAREEEITGHVLNDAAGVVIDAFGTRAALEAFVTRLRREPPPAASIRALDWAPIPVEGAREFVIAESRGAPDTRLVSIPPDLATCDECVAEIRDPAERRHRYPFTNCTACGPRFTIASDVPYDRARTSMARFAMCASCRREYEAPSDRRFHAQPIACPSCGPALVAVGPSGAPIPVGDAVAAAVSYLERGQIVAVKGLGGFHLACDATSADAVRRLRERKHRDEKPFAVMVRDLAMAEEIAVVGEAERALLASVERPIVLAPRRARVPIAADVAPDNPLIGVLLPYTPLHHLLMSGIGRPLVMTSGNLSDEPLAYRNDEALARLGRIADLFLLHDRDIVTRCDDSVAQVVAGRPMILRRSRGYVPRAIRLAEPVDRPILACGALLKNTFCLAQRDLAYFGPHIGDLENVDTFQSYEESIDRMQRFLGIRPDVIAYDLHPDYLSTRYALGRPEAAKVGVQHHHAHVASAIAEHGLEGPVIGVAFDGTGYGTDGSAWGGEILRADLVGFERIATFRPIPLAGGDVAVREPWRLALAMMDDAFEGLTPLDALPLFQKVDAAEVDVVRRMIARRFNAPPAHGVGRYFDAVGALCLARPRATFEGQVALAWNLAANPSERRGYAFVTWRDRDPWAIDLREAVLQIVRELVGGVPVDLISARFHNTLVEATADVVRDVLLRDGPLTVVLTGGCFQNARLAAGLAAALSRDARVLIHRAVPPGDGGVALGQALVADAQGSG